MPTTSVLTRMKTIPPKKLLLYIVSCIALLFPFIHLYAFAVGTTKTNNDLPSLELSSTTEEPVGDQHLSTIDAHSSTSSDVHKDLVVDNGANTSKTTESAALSTKELPTEVPHKSNTILTTEEEEAIDNPNSANEVNAPKSTENLPIESTHVDRSHKETNLPKESEIENLQEKHFAPSTVRIVRVQTSSVSAKDDLIVLKNISSHSLSLTGWSLRRCKTSGIEKGVCTSTADSNSIFTAPLKNVTLEPEESITLTGESKLSDNFSVALFDDKKIIQDMLTWGTPPSNFKDAPVIHNPTNCEVIVWDDILKTFLLTHQERDICRPIDYRGEKLKLSEILPHPKSNDEEFIELFNATDTPINLRGWMLRDASSTGVYIFLEDTLIEPGTYHTVFRTHFGFALNNTGLESVSLLAPDKSLSDTMSYTGTHIGKSFNNGLPQWYEEEPTPSQENLPNPLTKDYPNILITEVFPYPSHIDDTEEYIELYNPTDSNISLKNWVLRDASATGEFHFDENFIISSKGYLAVDKSTFGFALNNTGEETVTLVKPNASLSDTITYEDPIKDQSFSRRMDAWSWTPVRTPSSKNDFLFDKIYPILILSEILPNPIQEEEKNEYIEIYNPTNTPVSLKYWTLMDSSATGTYTFNEDIIILPHTFHTLYRSNFGFALNNSGGETISLLAPNNQTTSSTSYQTAKKGISYGWTGDKWRWSKTQTPGANNIFGNELKIEDITISPSFKDVYTTFRVSTNLPNTSLAYRWSFGDDRKSYKKSTRHKYTVKGIFFGEVRVSNDVEEVTKTFKIDVSRYPSHNIDIIEIMPNPKGKDYGQEYILIKNVDNKKIDLRGWSIATGKDQNSLVNHPFREDTKIVLKKDESFLIRSQEAAISLNNKGGVVEVRRPDGSVSDILSYSYTRANSIPDNARFSRSDTDWTWMLPQTMNNIPNSNDGNRIVETAYRNSYNATQTSNLSLNTMTLPPQIIETPFYKLISQKVNHLIASRISKIHSEASPLAISTTIIPPRGGSALCAKYIALPSAYLSHTCSQPIKISSSF